MSGFSRTSTMKEFGRAGARIAVATLMTLLAVSALGHPLSVSYSNFAVHDDTVTAVFRLPIDDMDLLFSLDTNLDNKFSTAELDGASTKLNAYIRKNVHLGAGQIELEPTLHGSSIWRDEDGARYLQADVTYEAAAPIMQLKISVRLLTDLYSNHRNLAEIDFGNTRQQFVFQHQNTWTVKRSLNPWRTVKEFLFLGIEHILSGYDHLLFLLGLLLAGRGFRDLLTIVSSFTVAHSLTMALAVIGVVQPPGWMIEPAIALTIMYIGVENLFANNVRHRWKIAFAFGLVHGFGFASVLKELALETSGLFVTLVPFNLGVEIGQIAVIACIWPVLNTVRASRFQLPAMRGVSALIAAAGLFWFVERVT